MTVFLWIKVKLKPKGPTACRSAFCSYSITLFVRIVKQNRRIGRPGAISLPKNFVRGVDKCRRWGYYSVNITKMAVKRRVGLRIDPYQKARAMEKGRKQGTENGLGAAWAKCKSAKPATGTPVKASEAGVSPVN